MLEDVLLGCGGSAGSEADVEGGVTQTRGFLLGTIKACMNSVIWLCEKVFGGRLVDNRGLKKSPEICFSKARYVAQYPQCMSASDIAG